MSMAQDDALTVLLTGRSESGFADLIKKMVKSKGLEFDMIVLKPLVGPQNQKIVDTMAFKQLFLEDLMETYKDAMEIKVYEDRPKHTARFREWLAEYNRKQNGEGGMTTRGPITADVVQVAEGATLLDPIVETAEIQRLIDDHNKAIDEGQPGRRLMIKKTVYFTGYMISPEDQKKLLTLVDLPPNANERDVKYLGSNIMICPRPATDAILEKVGGMGNKLLWQVSLLGDHDKRVWACQVKPVVPGTTYYTENAVPNVVLALNGRDAKPFHSNNIRNWRAVPAEKQFIFETVVGEKVLLSVEDASDFNKRKDHDFDAPTGPREGGRRGGYRGGGGFKGDGGGRGGRARNFQGQRGQGGRGRGHGDRGGGQRGGRGRGGFGKYTSLDDMGGSNNEFGSVKYEDYQPPKQEYREDYPGQPAAHMTRQTQGQRLQQRDYDYQGRGGRGNGGGRGRGGGGGGGGAGGMNGGDNVGDLY